MGWKKPNCFDCCFIEYNEDEEEYLCSNKESELFGEIVDEYDTCEKYKAP